MANELYFEVGIKGAVKRLDKVKQELDQFITDYTKKMKIQVDIKELETFINALKSIGNGDQLKPLLAEVERLQNRLAAMNDKGQYFDMLRGDAKAAAEAVKIAEERLKNMKITGNQQFIANAKTSLRQAQMEAARTAEVLASATERFAKEEAKTATVTTETKAKIDALGQSVTDLHTKIGNGISVNLGGDFSQWANEVNGLTSSVKELVGQFEKMGTTIKSSGTALTDVQNQIAESANKRAKSAEKTAAAQTDVMAKSEEELRLEKEKVEIKTRIANLTTQINQKQQEINDYRNQLKNTQAVNELEVKKKIEQTETQIKDLENQRAELQKKIANEAERIVKATQSGTRPAQSPLANQIADTEKLLRRIETAGNKSLELKIDTSLLRIAQRDVKDFAEKISSFKDFDNTKAINEIIGQYNRLVRVYGEVAAAQERLNTQTEKHNNKVDAAYMKEVEAFTKKSIKEYHQREKAAQKAAEAELKAYNKAEEDRLALVERTRRQIESVNAAITRGQAAKRDMSTLKNQLSLLNGQKALLEKTNAKDSAFEKRMKDVKTLVGDTDRLRKSEEKLTTARERANKRNDNQALKNLEKEEKSVNDAYIQYNKLGVKIEELNALRARGLKANLDVSGIDNYIQILERLKRLMQDIFGNSGKMPLSNNAKDFGFATAGLLTSQVLAHNNVQADMLWDGKGLNDYKANLKDIERRMNAASTTAENLGKYIDKLEAKKVDFQGLDLTRLNAAVQRVRDIQNELERFAQTGKSMHGDTANAIVRSMGLEAAKKEVGDAMSKLTEQKKTAASVNVQLSESEQRLANAIKGSTQEMKGQSQVLSDLKMMAMQYLSVWGAQNFISNVIEIGGKLEQQRLSLSAILGDMEKATTLFGQIKSLALKSPFGVVELDQMSKQLSAYSFEYDELFDWTKRLADISAATGTSVDRLALALGHVRSEGALSGYTLRQFAMANVPVLRMLSENLGISTKEVRERVKKKEISADDVQEILKQLTDDGGMFANAQETMSEALNAKFKNLRDAFDIMYGEIAESGIGDKLKGFAEILTAGAKHWQRLATDIKDVAISFGVAKVAMLVYNNALGKGTAITYKSALSAKQKEAANLRLAASYRELSAAEQFNLKTSGWLNSMNIATLLSTNKLTVAELERLVALGKVEKGIAISAMRQKGLNTAQMESIVVLKGWSKAWAIAKYNIDLAMISVKRLLAAAWPLLALTAGFELWNRRSEQKDAAKEIASSMAGNLRGREAFELNGNLADSNKLSEEALRQNIGEMQKALEAANAYTKELKDQIDATEDLKEKYDILKVSIVEVADAYEKQKAVQGKMLGDAFDVGGGFLSDNMLKDAEQYDDAVAEYVKKLTIGSKQIKDVLSEWLKTQGQFKDEYSKMTGKQIFESLSDDLQRTFLNHFSNGKFASALDESTQIIIRDISRAYNNVGNKLSEMSGEQGDEFASIMKSMYEDAFGVDLDQAEEDQKKAFAKWLDETLARAEKLSKDAQEALSKITIKAVFGMEVSYEVVDDSFEKFLEDFKKDNPLAFEEWNRHGVVGGNEEQRRKSAESYKRSFSGSSATSIGNDAKKKIKELSEERKKLVGLQESIIYKENKEFADNNDKRIKEIDAEIERQKQAQKDYNQYGDQDKKKGGSKEDVNAKAVRERVRVLKEAADAYQYWRKAVGDEAALSHVSREFGEVLKTIEVDVKNAEDLRENLERIKTTDAYKNIKDKKVKTEIDKEIAKELDQLKRKDFEKLTEEFLSKTKVEIDELTQKWDIFNSVVETTGDRMLAARMSGISPGATPADLKRLAVSKAAGVDLDFDRVLGMSDKEIDEYVNGLGIVQARIKGIQEGLKDWKKSQQDVLKSDIQNYAKWLGGLADLQTIQRKNQEDFNRVLEETNRLRKAGVVSEQQAGERKQAAWTERMSKDWEASTMYARLYGNAQMMAKDEFAVAYQREMDNLNQKLLDGTLTAEKYAEAVSKLNKVESEFSSSGFLGLKGGVGAFLTGGYSGLIEYHRNRAKDLRAQGNIGEADQEDKHAESMEKAQKASEQLAKSFEDLQKGADMLSNLLSALGMNAAAGEIGDVASVFGGVASGAMSLSALGPYGMLAGGVIGGLTSALSLGDKYRQEEIEALQRNVNALEQNTESIRSARERTLGYDSGSVRRQMAKLYKDTMTEDNFFGTGGKKLTVSSAAKEAMQAYYRQNGNKNGYAAELANLKDMREEYIKMYDEENKKKDSSNDALDEYKQKIADLDEQILYYTEDLANELWGIDFKSWASQISDALWTAFENGENAVDAFRDTANDIISDVAKKMMNLHFIEPAFKELEKELFGEMVNGERVGGVAITDNAGKLNEKATLEILGKYLGEGGYMEKQIEAAKQFYELAEKASGLDFGDTSSKSKSSTVKGITEETAGLLAAYVNSIRADVAMVRDMDMRVVKEYWPAQLRAMTAGNESLRNIEGHTSAIMRSNETIAQKVSDLDARMARVIDVDKVRCK